MKKKYYFIGCIVITIISIVAIIYGVHIYSQENISEKIGFESEFDESNTTIEKVEQEIIHFEDEIGLLTIPDILLLNVPIREGTDADTLNETIGHIKETSLYEGNVGLMGLNCGNKGDFFRNLKKIKIGSEIFYQTENGTKRYLVKTKKVILKSELHILENVEEDTITLITGYEKDKNKIIYVEGVESIEGLDYFQ